MQVAKSWKQAKWSGSHFEIQALLRDNAKPGDDDGVKVSGDNGAPKPSGTARSKNENGASQFKRSESDNGALKPSESYAQVSLSQPSMATR